MQMGRMSCPRNLSAFLILVLSVPLTLMVGASAPDGGASTYTPTKAEWLCLQLNMEAVATSAASATKTTSFAYFEPSDRDPNQIVIKISSMPTATAASLRFTAEAARNRAIAAARRKGWDAWLTMKVQRARRT